MSNILTPIARARPVMKGQHQYHVLCLHKMKDESSFVATENSFQLDISVFVQQNTFDHVYQAVNLANTIIRVL